MSKFSVNYNELDVKINKKAFKLSEVKDRLVKVAFDVVRFKDGDEAANLWQIQSADDGDYIVALYKEEEMKAEAGSDWAAVLTKGASDIQVYYKNEPIVRVASSKLGINKDELELVPSYLPEKLAENKKLVSSLLNMLSETAKKEVFKKYPELK